MGSKLLPGDCAKINCYACMDPLGKPINPVISQLKSPSLVAKL